MSITKTKIPSTKGNLATAIHYSKNKTDKLAILCPGYLDSKDYKGLVGLAETLEEQGYTVVRFDPTGIWESEGDISDYTTSQYLEDIKNVLDHMLSQADYRQILLGGHSRGGQISILYAARDSRISIVLGIMPSSGPIQGPHREEWERAGVSISQRDLPNDKDKTREFRVPFNHVLDRDQYDAVCDVKKIKVPIIFIAGEWDNLVPSDKVKKIFDSANEPKKFLIIPKIGHDYRYNDSEVKTVNKKILELLNSIYSSRNYRD
jgi:pimeloyl-ACP methyl ester carboxylesterase